MKEIETNSLFVLGEGVIELVAVAVERGLSGFFARHRGHRMVTLQPKRPVTEETVPPA